jgi:hypothetical protein
VCFYLFLYAVLLLAVRKLVLASSRNIWILALLLSPATLSFQVLHPRSGFSKELIHIVGLALFAYLLKTRKMSPVATTAYIGAVVVLGVLSHEGLLFYAPYFFAALVIGGRTPLQALKQCALPAAAGLLTAYICSTHIGNFEVASQICSSLGYKLNVPGSSEVCASGAIPYLIRTREFARAETVDNIRHYQYFLIFPFFAALGLLPAIGESLVLVRARLSRDVIVIWLTTLIAFLSTLVLFFYAYDWGRWIYIHLFSIAILFIFADGKRIQDQDVVGSERAGGSLTQRVASAAFLFVYATCWILPNGIEPVRMGYVARVLHLAHYGSNAPMETRERTD